MSGLFKAAADWIFKDISDGKNMTHIPEQLAVQNLAECYSVQEELHQRFQEAGAGAIVGWKIALTTPTMQAFVGIDHPTAGAIFESRVHSSGATLSASDYVNLGVESEIAVRIATDLPKQSRLYGEEDIGSAIVGVMAATELVDDRNLDYSNPDPHYLICANSLNAGCVLGPEQSAWPDLAGVEGIMRINGEVQGRGSGADVLGHPHAAVAWLANHLIERGTMLRKGDIVMTGSVVKTAWLKPGDHMATEMIGLGSAEFTVAT